MKFSRMKKYGWSEQEIADAHARSPHKREHVLFVLLLCFFVVGSVYGVSYAYSFISQIIPVSLFPFIVFFVGAMLGALFALFLFDVDRLTHSHHVLVTFFLPVLASGSMFISLSSISQGLFSHNVYIVSLLFGFGMVVTYGALVIGSWILMK